MRHINTGVCSSGIPSNSSAVLPWSKASCTDRPNPTARWNSEGDELFFQTTYTNDVDMMVVGVKTEPELQLTEPKRLFGGADANINIQRGWSVSSDGQRILGVRTVTPESDTRRITVVENWYREFQKQ